MIASLGILVSGDEVLVSSLRRVLKTLARNQTRLGHIPSLVHDSEDLGASDTMPLFLIALALFRKAAGKGRFLEGPARKALAWMDYQSPENRALVAQQPTSDWRGSIPCLRATHRQVLVPVQANGAVLPAWLYVSVDRWNGSFKELSSGVWR